MNSAIGKQISDIKNHFKDGEKTLEFILAGASAAAALSLALHADCINVRWLSAAGERMFLDPQKAHWCAHVFAGMGFGAIASSVEKVKPYLACFLLAPSWEIFQYATGTGSFDATDMLLTWAGSTIYLGLKNTMLAASSIDRQKLADAYKKLVSAKNEAVSYVASITL